mmetsp:Transcript_9436/g.20931  ORF Transcript_9436/g.20931 Transcript_9436/m.20931 type:complete len:644 (-) Transcript_9436:630-2561(-)
MLDLPTLRRQSDRKPNSTNQPDSLVNSIRTLGIGSLKRKNTAVTFHPDNSDDSTDTRLRRNGRIVPENNFESKSDREYKRRNYGDQHDRSNQINTRDSRESHHKRTYGEGRKYDAGRRKASRNGRWTDYSTNYYEGRLRRTRYEGPESVGISGRLAKLEASRRKHRDKRRYGERRYFTVPLNRSMGSDYWSESVDTSVATSVTNSTIFSDFTNATNDTESTGIITNTTASTDFTDCHASDDTIPTGLTSNRKKKEVFPNYRVRNDNIRSDYIPKDYNPNDYIENVYIVKQNFGAISFLFGVTQIVVFTSMLAKCGVAPFFDLDINPFIGPFPDVLNYYGASNAYLMTMGEWWRVFTSIVLDTSALHLLVTVGIQLEHGTLLEKEWGSLTWFIIYVVSGMAGCITSCIFMPDSISVGSSGAIFGLFGAKLADVLCRSFDKEEETLLEYKLTYQSDQAFKHLCICIGILINFSFLPNLDWACHLGGFLGGLFIGMALFKSKCYFCICSTLAGCTGYAFVAIFIAYGLFYISFDLQPNENLGDYCSYFQESSGFNDYLCICDDSSFFLKYNLTHAIHNFIFSNDDQGNMTNSYVSSYVNRTGYNMGYTDDAMENYTDSTIGNYTYSMNLNYTDDFSSNYTDGYGMG